MNEKGFIASSLLYGMLALFIVVMLSTLALLGNRKLAMDQLKKNALITVEMGYSNPENIVAIYDSFQKPNENRWFDLSGNKKKAEISGGVNFMNEGVKFDSTTSYIDTEITGLSVNEGFAIVTTATIGNGVLWSYGDIYAEKIDSNLKVCINEECTESENSISNGKAQLTFIFNENGFQVYNNTENFMEGSITDQESNTSASVHLYIGNNNSLNKRYTGSVNDFIVYKGMEVSEESKLIVLSDEAILNNYGIDADSNLEVYLNIHKKGANQEALKLNNDSKMSLTIPLSKKAINIKMSYNEINNNSQTTGKATYSIKDYRLFLAACGLLVLAIILIICIVHFIIKSHRNRSEYDKYISKVLNEYDRLIAESSTLLSFEGKDVISITKFTELLDIHDNLQLPIMYYEVEKHNQCYFYINKDNTVYILEVNVNNLNNVK